MAKNQTATPKDPDYAKKLDESARKMFGRNYRFLSSTQKTEVNRETPFTPKPAETASSAPVNQTPPPTKAQEAQSHADPKRKEAPAAVPVKPAETFVDYITQWKCEDGHITNGKRTAPPKHCLFCRKPATMSGYYVDDQFVAGEIEKK